MDNEQTGITSPLLRLPAELRNRILELVLIKHSHSIILRPKASTDPDSPKEIILATPPALAQTNKQLRHESMPIWQANNTFAIIAHRGTSSHDALHALFAWLHTLQPETRRAMRKVLFCARGGEKEERDLKLLCWQTKTKTPLSWEGETTLGCACVKGKLEEMSGFKCFVVLLTG